MNFSKCVRVSVMDFLHVARVVLSRCTIRVSYRYCGVGGVELAYLRVVLLLMTPIGN